MLSESTASLVAPNLRKMGSVTNLEARISKGVCVDIVKESEGFRGGSDGKESICPCRRHGFAPWVRKICWRREWLSTPVFLPGESQGQRSLVGYSPWGCKELEMTERTHVHTCTHTHTLLGPRRLQDRFPRLIYSFQCLLAALFSRLLTTISISVVSVPTPVLSGHVIKHLSAPLL